MFGAVLVLPMAQAKAVNVDDWNDFAAAVPGGGDITILQNISVGDDIPSISNSINIIGNGNTFIGNGKKGFVVNSSGNLTIDNIIANGLNQFLSNSGTVVISNSQIMDTIGAIYNTGSSLTILNTSFYNN
jgi:hypothetical protein